MLFKSAVDWWYYALLALLAAALVAALTPTILAGQFSLLTAAALAVALLGVPLWLLFTTAYRVADGMLTVQSGPFSWRIPLAEIESVTPSHSLLSSPALSLERLEVRYSGGKRLLLSPEDRQGFLAALAVCRT